MWSFPLLAEEGWLRHQLKSCEATEAAADGVVSSAKSSGLNSFAELTTPTAPFRNGIHFYVWRVHPSSARRGILCASSIHSPLDRPPLSTDSRWERRVTRVEVPCSTLTL